MNMTISLFDSIINTSQDCVFWKDKDRRFLGVNQAFLDFYGFESEEVLIGKNDEDMGWHNDPEPYKQDELRVLSGESTYKVHGKCMVGEEERDIIASKRPLYENGEIVGLVGSFIDITELVRRQKRAEERQIVYTVGELRKHPYWDKLLDSHPLIEILDPLTGVISRSFMNDFASFLISNETKFSLSILDLDNFKFTNDRHGHAAGDEVLKDVTRSLADYTEGFGFVGRFGGDELLLINLRDTEREDNESFWNELYASHKVFRREIAVEGGRIFVTCTTGSASCPADSRNLDELFSMIDKSLYIGKGKGRNCYTVYVDEEHRNLEIKKIAKHNMSSDMVRFRNALEGASTLRDGLIPLMLYLKELLKVDDLYYIDGKGVLRAVLDGNLKEDVRDAGKSIRDELFVCDSANDIKDDSPRLFDALQKLNISSFIAASIRKGEHCDGFLVCATHRKHRIWQENERAYIYYLAVLIGNSASTDAVPKS